MTRDDFGEKTVIAGGARPALRDRQVHLLVMISGGIQQFSLPADGGPYLVGRSPSADVFINAASVSREHARVTVEDDAVYVEDLGSTNGTQLNGDRVGRKPVLVEAGDALRFGDVLAQLRGARSSRSTAARVLGGADFELRLGEEGERCLRFGRCAAAIAVDVGGVEAGGDRERGAQRAIQSALRVLDVLTRRSSGRFDVFLAECEKDEAAAVARRIERALAASGVAARLGVAGYPSDVPSFDSLLLAAQLAMHTLDGAGIAVAAEGVRTLQIGAREVIVAEPAMIRLFGFIERLAGAPIPVLVHGETGSGKEIVAEALHALGARSGGALVKLNCAAVPEQLLESELFGHEKGAFSGADAAKPGLFEEADGGTLFLDEIGEMTPALQAKLLRVLEGGFLRRVGATKERRVDVRVVAATHRDLQEAVAAGRFRQDLYFRLSGMVLEVPPLRERRREIPLLAERFAAELSRRVGRAPVAVGPAALSALQSYEWPGNVRELRNAISVAVTMCDAEELGVEHLPPGIGAAAAEAVPHEVPPSDEVTGLTDLRALPLEEELRALEKRRIAEALAACDGNQTQAARLLQMPRRTLVRKLATLGIDARAARGAKSGG